MPALEESSKIYGLYGDHLCLQESSPFVEYTPWAHWLKATAVDHRPADDPEVLSLWKTAHQWGPYPIREIRLPKGPRTHARRIQELTKFKEDPWLKRFAVDIDAAISWHEQKIVYFQDGRHVENLDYSTLDPSKGFWSEAINNQLPKIAANGTTSITGTSSIVGICTSASSSASSSAESETWPDFVPNPPDVTRTVKCAWYEKTGGGDDGMFQVNQHQSPECSTPFFIYFGYLEFSVFGPIASANSIPIELRVPQTAVYGGTDTVFRTKMSYDTGSDSIFIHPDEYSRLIPLEKHKLIPPIDVETVDGSHRIAKSPRS
ncbi:hypothetical protein V8E54_010357 [Elaphomyces granulatus]